MKQLLSALEMALDSCIENQEMFLSEGGVQDILSLAVLDVSARKEVRRCYWCLLLLLK